MTWNISWYSFKFASIDRWFLSNRRERVNWAWSVVASFEWNPYQDTTWLRSLYFRSFFSILWLLLHRSFCSPLRRFINVQSIPQNRQEWRAPDDNNVNRIPSARKSIETPRTSFRKEHTFLHSVSRRLESTPYSLLKDDSRCR